MTDDKNEVLRLRSFLCEAEEDVHHLSEDLIDAKQAQQRANQALKAKDQKLSLVAEELDQLKKSQSKPINGEEQSELQRCLQKKGLRTEKALEEHILGQALSQATEMVEEMRAEWEANGVIEVAKAREEGERKARGLQQQLLAAREQLLAQQRGFAEEVAAKEERARAEERSQLLPQLAEAQQALAAQREAREAAEARAREEREQRVQGDAANRRLHDQLRAQQALVEQEQQTAVGKQAEEAERRAVLLKRVASLERVEKEAAEAAEARGAADKLRDTALRLANAHAHRLQADLARLQAEAEHAREAAREAAEAEERRRGEEREERRRGEQEVARLRALLQAEQAQRQRANSTLVAAFAAAEAEKTSLAVALATARARAQEQEREMEVRARAREAAEAKASMHAASLASLSASKAWVEARVREVEREGEAARRLAEDQRLALGDRHAKEVEALTEQIETLILAAPLVEHSPSPTRNGKEQEMEMMEREVGRLRRELDEKRAELKAVSSLTPPPDFSALQLTTLVDTQEQQAVRRECQQHVEAMVGDMRRLRSDLSSLVSDHARARYDLLAHWRSPYPAPAPLPHHPHHPHLGMGMHSPYAYSYQEPHPQARDPSSASPESYAEWDSGRREVRALPARRWPWFLSCFGGG